MPPSYTPIQKGAIAQFTGFTSTKDSVAAKHLKAHNWNVEQAIDAGITQVPSPQRLDLTLSGTTDAISYLNVLYKMSLSMDRQWNIVEAEWRRTGRGPKGKILEQEDEVVRASCTEEEKAREKDLEIVSEQKIAEESEQEVRTFWVSTIYLLHSWLARAADPNDWIELENLPMYIRYAIRRPLMPEREFVKGINLIGIQFRLPMGDVRQPRTVPIGPHRRLLYGLEASDGQCHVSFSLQDRLSRGSSPVNQEAYASIKAERERDNQSDEEEREQLLRSYLRSIYDAVRDGLVPLEKAPVQYRDALDLYDIDNDGLIACLQQFGVPVDQIPTNEQHAGQGSVALQERNDGATDKNISGSEKVKNDQTVEMIQDLQNYVELYRTMNFETEEVVLMIQNHLGSLRLHDDDITEILTDIFPDSRKAAVDMWEMACKSRSPAQERDVAESQARAGTSNASSLDRNSNETGYCGGTSVVHKSFNEELTTSSQDEDRKIDESLIAGRAPASPGLMLPPPLPPKKDNRHRDRSCEQKDSAVRPGTPVPDSPSAVTITSDGNPEMRIRADWDGAVSDDEDDSELSSSPEKGFTSSLWGLFMSTRKARELAHRLKLPTDYVEKQYHSITPRRIFSKKARKSKNRVTFHKRKASSDVHEGSRAKKIKSRDHYEVFAHEGENQESFVLSHFKPEVTLRGNSKDGMEYNCSSDDKLVKGDRPAEGKSPENSTSILPYLTRVMQDTRMFLAEDSILAKIRNLEHRPMSGEALRTIASVLDHLREGVITGEITRPGGKEDEELIVILACLTASSATLKSHASQDMWNFLLQEADESHSQKDPETSVDRTDLRSSMLNNATNLGSEPHPSSISTNSNAAERRDLPSCPQTPKLSTRLLSSPKPPPEQLPATPRLRAKDLPGGKSMNPPSQPRQEAPGFEDLPVWPPTTKTENPPDTLKDTAESCPNPLDDRFDSLPVSILSHSFPAGKDKTSVSPEKKISSLPRRNACKSEIEDRFDLMLRPTTYDLVHGFGTMTPVQSSRRQFRTAQELIEDPNGGMNPEPAQRDAYYARIRKLNSLPPEKANKRRAKIPGGIALKFAQEDALQHGMSFRLFLAEQRHLRELVKRMRTNADLKLNDNRFFQSTNGSSSSAATPSALSKQFDKYRDNPSEEPDKIGVEGSMRYLGDLGVKLDEVVLLAVLTELNAPTMGELTREGFLNGWTNLRADTLSKQHAQIASFRRALIMTPDFFKRVYKQTFLLARLPGQKVLPLENAIEYWRLLFTPPSVSWNTPRTPWLEWWIDYLENKWKKSCSKDMWDQTGVFVIKSLEDESMSWWSEDGAWPGVLDEFVEYVRGKRDGGNEMDVG